MTIAKLSEKLSEIEKIIKLSPLDASKKCRKVLIEVVDYIYSKIEIQKAKKASLLELIDNSAVTDYINDVDAINAMHYIRILGMNAEYGHPVKKSQANICFANLDYIINVLESKNTEKSSINQKKSSFFTEKETRKEFIDLYLNEAGWEVLETKNLAQPGKACIEIEVKGMPTTKGIGYCDYVLYGRDCRPLAIIEAKRTNVDPSQGRHQADLYAECMKLVYGYKPVIYYTNGYVTKIIDGIYPDREVTAFHTINELELMLQKRNRGNIVDQTVNSAITDRYYNQIACTKVCEWLNKKHRKSLLVMATGTGKTRLSIALVDILVKNNWVKNVLFLADRTSLVNQAKRAFSKYLPNMSICELSGKEEKDFNARLMFCTYQTMINYIDAENKPFSTGRFDLIIIDEAHRSIFNKYMSIFKYFDSFLIGLTATPKNEVDANTYRMFDCEAGIPNFDYSMEQAVKEGFLVGYKVINRTSSMLKDGISWNNLTEDEKKQLEEYFESEEEEPNLDFTISSSKIFKKLYNKDTCRKVLEELDKWGLRVDGGETLGKTIIFAYDHTHAQMIVDCFHDLFPDYPANTCQLVDYSVKKAEDLVIKFEEDPEFRIAVSVDMLDTGVDITSILNLVFFKTVRSKIKFIQMIGRGTRVCADLLGPGKNKNKFLIFDYCGNFEYFKNHPDAESKFEETITLTKRRFDVQTEIVRLLQNLTYQEDEWLQNYYNLTKESLLNQVISLKNKGSKRIQVRNKMQFVDKYADINSWQALSPVDVKELQKHISPLLSSGLLGDPRVIAFDIRMYNIEKGILSDDNKALEDIKVVVSIADYLCKNKGSVEEVKSKSDDLKLVLNIDFWQDLTPQKIKELERLRISLRDLMTNITHTGKKKIEIDIADYTFSSDYIPDDTTIDIRTYREKVIDYLEEHLTDNKVIKKIHNLEQIDSNDLKELEQILWHDLGSYEDYSFTTEQNNLAAFVRSLIGLNQEAVNQKFSQYLSSNLFNSQQQEFVQSVINYVRQNGDIDREELVNSEPFDNFDLNEFFNETLPAVLNIVDTLHSTITVNQPE